MGQLICILGQIVFGVVKGNCETCGLPGWKQTSIVDPLSPNLRIYCQVHHAEYQLKLQHATVRN